MTTIESKTKELNTSLSASVMQVVERHLLASQGEKVVDLYRLVMEEVEAPLYRAAMEHCRYNQSRAALLLNVSRSTLRRKLTYYFGDKYLGTSDGAYYNEIAK